MVEKNRRFHPGADWSLTQFNCGRRQAGRHHTCMNKPVPSFPLSLALAVTVAAVVADYYALTSLNVSGLMPAHFVAAEVVRTRCPFHLVPVEWVSGPDQITILNHWNVAEIRARLTLVLVMWVAAMSLLVWRYFRAQDKNS